jgi:hypothetical protein
MAGPNAANTLPNSLDVVVDSARVYREYLGVHQKTCEQRDLPNNSGLNWDEITIGQFTAQNGLTDLTELDNPQTFTETVIRLTPTMVGLNWIITKKMRARVNSKVLAQLGKVAMNAMARAKDESYIGVGQSSTMTFGSAGTAFTIGHANAMKRRVEFGDNNEPATGKISLIAHTYHVAALEDQITTGVGTYPVPSGISQDLIRGGFKGDLWDMSLYVDNNITRDASDDAILFCHPKEGVIYVQGMDMANYTKDRPEIAGGATEYYIYDDYTFGYRAAYWLASGTFDAATQSS